MERLREIRIRSGTTQKEMSEILGVDRTTYVKYESGKNEPNFETIKIIADHFNVSVDYLLGRTDDTETSVRDQIHDEFPGLQFALYKETEELDEKDLEDVLNFARFIREKKKKGQ